MSAVRRIIDKTLSKNIAKTDFDGKVYFYHDKIDSITYNKLLKEYKPHLGKNLKTVFESEILLALLLEEEDNTFDETSYLHISTLFFDIGFLHLDSLYEDETEVNVVFKIIYWDEIEFVQKVGTDEKAKFRFYFKDSTDYTEISIYNFNIKEFKSVEILLNLFNKIIEYKNNPIDDSIEEHSVLKEEILNFFNNGNYEKALVKLENFKKICNVDDVYTDNYFFYYYGKTRSLIELNQLENALETIDIYLNKNIGEINPDAYLIKGEILYKTNKFISAVNCLAISEENYSDDEYKRDANKLKEKSYSKLKEIFLDVPYSERKLIFIGEQVYSTKTNDIIVLKKNDIPANIIFPIGHPHVHQVYTCHPHKQNLYLPLKDYSEELFLDRINEFSYLLQCLGAKSLEISSSKSNSSDQRATYSTEVDAKMDYKINSASVNYKGENTANTLVDGKLKITKKQVFKPSKAPFVPANLLWYHSDLNWQRLVDQRLNGNIMAHSELISSSQSENISSYELKQIDAELKLLLPKIGVSYNSDNDISSSSRNTHEWILTVEFEDVDKLITGNHTEPELLKDLNEKNQNFNSKLEKYREDVLIMIEDDGVIDDMERNILNRKIKKYGISKEDAIVIENELLTTGYAENELNYIQELKEFLEDGGIGETERKILDRYALKFGIEKSKQMDIDKIFIN